MAARVQRSMLILPANVPRFVEKAYRRGADAVVLDLEDSVPPTEKQQTRTVLKEAVGAVGKGGADVLVRVNNEPELLGADLDAAVMPGLHALFVPKVETPKDVLSLEDRITALEKARGISLGTIKTSLHIESPRGLLNIREIVAAGTRTESMSLGVDDYCLHLGVEPTEEASELLFPLTVLVTACKAGGISPLGIMGTVAGFRDPAGFERAAQRGRGLGCAGAFCIHPDQVPILNRVFTPSPAMVDHARRVVAAFEAGLKTGRASVSLDNRMVDTPIYKQALRVLERAAAVEAREREKEAALASIESEGGPV